MVDQSTIDTVVEVAKVAGNSLVLAKLLDVAKSGIGAVARPWMIKRDAGAHGEGGVGVGIRGGAGGRGAGGRRRKALPPAPELQAPRSSELTRPADTGLVIDVDWEDLPPLAKRTEQRLTYQEEKRQLNVESVIREAAEELQGATEISDEPVDDDWTARFFGSVQDVSNGRMRKLWAKILAGEVVKPGSFSPRTLEILRNIDPKDADLFTRAARLATRNGAILSIGEGKDFQDIQLAMTLTEAGLFNTRFAMSYGLRSTNDDRFHSHINFRDVALRIAGENPKGTVAIEAVALTRVGRELASVVATESCRQHLRDVADYVQTYGHTVTAHRIVRMTDEHTADYDETPIDF